MQPQKLEDKELDSPTIQQKMFLRVRNKARDIWRLSGRKDPPYSFFEPTTQQQKGHLDPTTPAVRNPCLRQHVVEKRALVRFYYGWGEYLSLHFKKKFLYDSRLSICRSYFSDLPSNEAYVGISAIVTTTPES